MVENRSAHGAQRNGRVRAVARDSVLIAVQVEFSDSLLDRLRTLGDSAADAAVRDLVANNRSLSAATLIPELLTRLSCESAPDDPVAVWLDGCGEFPDWADPALLARGREFFRTWGLAMSACLFLAGLPWDYAAANGAETLAAASDLASGDVRRRIAETGQFLFDIHDLGAHHDGDGVDSQALLSIRGVRLLHAGVRHRVLTEDPSVTQRWGYPINQEDLMGTLLSFTTVPLAALSRVGTWVGPEDRDAYLHLWNVVGVQLGIDGSLLPLSWDDAVRLQRRIEEHQHAPSPAGQRLTAALLTDMELSMPRGLRKLPRALVRQVAGHRTADLLGVPKAPWWAPALALLAAVGRRLTRIAGVRAISSWPLRLLARAMISGYIDAGLAGRRARFRIDEELMKQWRIGRREWRRRSRERRRAGLVERLEVAP
jgi:ER-bound oxygenase mpaB/B'/Rubber oxygenase, catalytic domain